MKQWIVLVVIAVVALGAGLAGGYAITNSKSKTAIADMQSKMKLAEASSQDRIRNYDNMLNRVTAELRQANIEIERLKNPTPETTQIQVSPSAATAGQTEQVVINTPHVQTEMPDGPPAGTKLYIIQSGDSLWTIAQKQLGNGSRFNEILKLNPKMSAKSNLVVGSKLKIPAK